MPMCPNCGSYVSAGSPMCSCGTTFSQSSYDELQYVNHEESLRDIANNCCKIAKNHEKHGRYAEAINEYEKALHFNYSSKILISMGETFMKMGKYEEALECFEDSRVGGYESFLLYGETLAYLERYDEAFEKFDIAIEKIENLFKPYDEPEDERDRERYQRLNEKKETDKNKALSRAYNKIGWTYYLKGDYDKAIKYFEDGIARDYDYSNNWNCKAIALQYKGEYEKALKFFDIALSMDDDEVIRDNRKRCLDEYNNKTVENNEKVKPESDDSSISRKYDPDRDWNGEAVEMEYEGHYPSALKYYDIALGLCDDPVVRSNRQRCLEKYAKAFEDGSVEWSEYLTEALDYASSKKGGV